MNFFDAFYFSYINQRNRMRNQIEKEEALKVEFDAMKGAVADPFTRRHSRPTLVTKVSNNILKQKLSAPCKCLWQ